MTNTKFYYDITRLVKRSRSTTPSGVDNVDLQYALFFMNYDDHHSKKNQICFVLQTLGGIKLLDLNESKDFILSVEENWKVGSSTFNKIEAPSKVGDMVSNSEAKDYISFSVRRVYIDYKSIFNQIISFKPKRLLGGLFNWFNYFPRVIRVPILFLLAVFISPIFSIFNFYKKCINLLMTPESNKHQTKEVRRIYFNTSQVGLDNNFIFKEIIQYLGCTCFFYIHDLIPIYNPEYVVEGSGEAHEKRLLNIVSLKNKKILFNSQFTQDCFHQFCNEHCIEHSFHESDVLKIGVDSSFLNVKNIPSQVKDLSGNYFVILGTIEPRKNHMLLINIWKKIVRENVAPPKLVVIGKRGWLNEHILYELERSLYLKEFVIELNDVSNEELVKILKSARALLFPSFSEGWGMPLSEALSLGVPVICSDLDVFREVGQQLPIYISPLDGVLWEKRILELNDESMRDKEIKKIASKYTPSTWEDHFKSLLSHFNYDNK